MPRNHREPRNPHTDHDTVVADTLGMPPADNAVPDADDQGRRRASPQPDQAGERSRRLTVDLTERTRRQLAAAAALAGLTSKAALATFATAVGRGDDRALSLLEDVRNRPDTG